MCLVAFLPVIGEMYNSESTVSQLLEPIGSNCSHDPSLDYSPAA